MLRSVLSSSRGHYGSTAAAAAVAFVGGGLLAPAWSVASEDEQKDGQGTMAASLTTADISSKASPSLTVPPTVVFDPDHLPVPLPPCKSKVSENDDGPSPFMGSLGTIKEYRTGKIFPLQREPIPPQEEANEMFGEDEQITQAASLLGSNTRCMLGLCRVAIARAYAFALYANDDALVGVAQALKRVKAAVAAAAAQRPADSKAKKDQSGEELLPSVLDWATYLHLNTAAEAEAKEEAAAAKKRKLTVKRPSDSALEFAFAQPQPSSPPLTVAVPVPPVALPRITKKSGAGGSGDSEIPPLAPAVTAAGIPEFSLVLIMARPIDGAHLSHGFKNSILFRLQGVEKRIAFGIQHASPAPSPGASTIAAFVDPLEAAASIVTAASSISSSTASTPAASSATSPSSLAPAAAPSSAAATTPAPPLPPAPVEVATSAVAIPDAASLRADALASGKASIPSSSSASTASPAPSTVKLGVPEDKRLTAREADATGNAMLEELHRFIRSFHGVKFQEGDEVAFTWSPATGRMLTAFRRKETEEDKKKKKEASAAAASSKVSPASLVAGADDPTFPIASDPLLPAHMDTSATKPAAAPAQAPSVSPSASSADSGEAKKADSKPGQEEEEDEDDSDWDGLLTRVVKDGTLTHAPTIRALFEVYAGSSKADPRFGPAPGKPQPAPVSARAKATFESNISSLLDDDAGIIVRSEQPVPVPVAPVSSAANEDGDGGKKKRPLQELKRWLKGKLRAEQQRLKASASGSGAEGAAAGGAAGHQSTSASAFDVARQASSASSSSSAAAAASRSGAEGAHAAAAVAMSPCFELRPGMLADAVKKEHASRTK